MKSAVLRQPLWAFDSKGRMKGFIGKSAEKKLSRFLMRRNAKEPAWVAFDLNSWLLAATGRGVYPVESGPAPGFYQSCLAGGGCWTSARACFQELAAASFSRLHGSEYLIEHTRSFQRDAQMESLIRRTGILGMGEIRGSRVFVLLREEVGGRVRCSVRGVDGSVWTNEVDGGQPGDALIPCTDFRVFCEPFASEVERMVFAIRDFERVFPGRALSESSCPRRTPSVSAGIVSGARSIDRSTSYLSVGDKVGQATPQPPFIALGRDGTVQLFDGLDASTPLTELLRLRPHQAHDPIWVSFDSELFLLGIDSETGILIRREHTPDLKFFHECLSGRGCWIGSRVRNYSGWAVLDAENFFRVYSSELLERHSIPFAWGKGDETLVDQRGFVGMATMEKAPFLFLIQKTAPLSFRNMIAWPEDYFYSREELFLDEVEFGGIDAITSLSQSSGVRVFTEPFSTDVERQVFARRDHHRAFR